ncbi:hypothetical protein SRABI80_04766 [Peribacillus frigoritolerans]|nr:hypothetical protein SRABI80_04766 [Peribacillus frigoritolerans]
MIPTPIVAKITEIDFLKVIFSFKTIRANITMNAGVVEVMMAPICAEESSVPTSWVTMEMVFPTSPIMKTNSQSRLSIRQDCFVIKPIVSNAKIAITYRNNTNSSGGTTSTTTFTTTYIPPQMLAASDKYKEPNIVFFIFVPSVLT